MLLIRLLSTLKTMTRYNTIADLTYNYIIVIYTYCIVF